MRALLSKRAVYDLKCLVKLIFGGMTKGTQVSEVILVRAPSWSQNELEAWLARRLRNGWISAVLRRLRRE
ncbi:hypothetical protein ABIB45_001195 [Arthrobacter sp. UYCo732]